MGISPNQNYGIIYTGYGCPARVGIGTINPLTTLDVRGSGYFGGPLTIKTANTRGVQMITFHDETVAYSVTRRNTEEDVFRVIGDGHVWCTELDVSPEDDFPDYVFTKEYRLMSLDNLENYISKNKHLPNIPTAADVEKNGLSVGKMLVKQLEKIEELTLYIIELKKELDALKTNNNLK